MLDGYLTTGMANKWYVQYTVHEMDARAEMEGGKFPFSQVQGSIAQDDACMCQHNCLGKQLRMRAAAEVL